MQKKEKTRIIYRRKSIQDQVQNKDYIQKKEKITRLGAKQGLYIEERENNDYIQKKRENKDYIQKKEKIKQI